jgi:hypothetical protein
LSEDVTKSLVHLTTVFDRRDSGLVCHTAAANPKSGEKERADREQFVTKLPPVPGATLIEVKSVVR